MIHAIAVQLLRELVWRTTKLLARLSLALLLMMMQGCMAGRDAILIEELQPGGRARLVQPGIDTSLEGVTIEGGSGMIGPQPGALLPPPPPDQWAAMIAAVAQAPCPFPGPEWLAAIAFVESDYGKNPGRSSAGAIGYAQFMPATLASYGIPQSQANNYVVMIPQMVRYLCAGGIDKSIDAALFSYNHSLAYVDHIKLLAASWATAAVAGWQDHPAVNQYAPSSWSNPINFQTWAGAACSAASLQWMLTAYHNPVTLDAAIGLLIPYVGIDPNVGLMDHTGAPLAAALGRASMTAWQQHIPNDAALRRRLLHGPAMLDGQRWFGVGHWFVAISSDDGGINIRESSGNDVRYLTWARLHGEVGWSGWAVGIGSPAPSNQA